MATQDDKDDIVKMACDGALDLIRKNASAEYTKLLADSGKNKRLIQAASTTATECMKLTAEFKDQPTNIAERLEKHLSKDRIHLILEGLNIETFRMVVSKKANGQHFVELSREGKPFMTGTRDLSGATDIDWATYRQYASIIVEVVLLVLSAAGFAPSVKSKVMEKTVEKVVREIQTSPALVRAIEDFIKAWNAAGGSAWKKAKAIFHLTNDTYTLDIFWSIIESLCEDMAWYDWLVVVAQVFAMLIYNYATNGAALIAEIALIVFSAVDFIRKMANVGQLNKIKECIVN